MAGAILVSQNNGVSWNSLDFDYIIKHIKSRFQHGEELVRDEIYSPVDKGGLSFISLTEQSDNGFNAFVRAAVLAAERDLIEHPLSDRKICWDELMVLLRADPRACSP